MTALEKQRQEDCVQDWPGLHSETLFEESQEDSVANLV